MHHANGQLLFSATDLSRHLACTHLTSLRRDVASRELEPPPPYDDPRGEVLKQRGLEHEQHLLDQLATDGRTVETIIPPDTPFSHRDPVAVAARTRDAMRRGADVIYQGRLEDDGGRWSGYPDFLLRVDRPSALGGWSYEVLDTKLARRAKGEALLQLLLYTDLLAPAQGIEPELMHLALGGGDSENPAGFRVAEYAAYYRAVRQRFEAHAASPPDTYPEPVEHCGVCEWKQACAERRRADDHLSLVAGITRGQRARLAERKVTTMATLGTLRLPVSPRFDGIGEAALARIREQARVQDQARREGRRIHELVTPVEPDKGSQRCPSGRTATCSRPRRGRLRGGRRARVPVRRRGPRRQLQRVVGTRPGEREACVRALHRRRHGALGAAHHGFHIYHYGAYETTAVKRLMSRYATREDKVDRLLRGRVFVDLHRVVRQGLRASVESYSIKRLEPFYGFAREVDLATATRALIQVEAQLESGDAAGLPGPLRAEIESYSRDDCLSTLRLAAWLEERRQELQALTGRPVPRPTLRDEERDREQGTGGRYRGAVRGAHRRAAGRRRRSRRRPAGAAAPGAPAGVPPSRGQVHVVGVLPPLRLH